MTQPTATPSFILVHPQLGENIGAAARVMANFGLSDLVLVAVSAVPPLERTQLFLKNNNPDVIIEPSD